MKTKYTFSIEQIEEYLNCEDYQQEFVIDSLCSLNGLYEIQDSPTRWIEFQALEIEFLTACVEYERRETRRIKIQTVFLKVKTWKVEVHAWVLKSVVDCLMSFGLVIRDEETEKMFQEREYEILIRSFKK